MVWTRCWKFPYRRNVRDAGAGWSRPGSFRSIGRRCPNLEWNGLSFGFTRAVVGGQCKGGMLGRVLRR